VLALLAGVDKIHTPFWNTSYPTTPLSESLEAFQLKTVEVYPRPELGAVNPDGVVGGVVSPPDGKASASSPLQSLPLGRLSQGLFSMSGVM
jgi:hypothetical protein